MDPVVGQSTGVPEVAVTCDRRHLIKHDSTPQPMPAVGDNDLEGRSLSVFRLDADCAAAAGQANVGDESRADEFGTTCSDGRVQGFQDVHGARVFPQAVIHDFC